MSSTPSHHNVMPNHVPTPGRSPLTVTPPPATTLVEIIRRDARAARGLDTPMPARSPR